MGTEPTAAARWRGSWPRLSLTLALHLLARRRRTVVMLILEVAKWRAFCGLLVSCGCMEENGCDVPGKRCF